MARKFLSTLRNALLAEIENDADPDMTASVDLLVAVHQRLAKLAAQIRSHAGNAPYSQIAAELHRIATEKQSDADELKKRVINYGGRTRDPTTSSASGKNHWERMVLDLGDQKSLEDFLQQQQARFASAEPEIIQILTGLEARQVSHRKALAKLVAIADPQATQT